MIFTEFQTLLDAGADVEARMESEATPLLIAALHGSFNALKVRPILQVGANGVVWV